MPEPANRIAPQAAASISAVMVTFATGPSLFRAIESLPAQPELGELILIDNGNPASTRARIRELAAADPQLRHRVTGRNLGFAAASSAARGATRSRPAA